MQCLAVHASCLPASCHCQLTHHNVHERRVSELDGIRSRYWPERHRQRCVVSIAYASQNIE
jgi:hypothetical protein